MKFIIDGEFARIPRLLSSLDGLTPVEGINVLHELIIRNILRLLVVSASNAAQFTEYVENGCRNGK